MSLHPKVIARAKEVQQAHGIPLKALCAHDSRWNVVAARQHLWALLVEHDGFTLPRAGRVTGHHHTTVLYGVRRHKARADLHAAASNERKAA